MLILLDCRVVLQRHQREEAVPSVEILVLELPTVLVIFILILVLVRRLDVTQSPERLVLLTDFLRLLSLLLDDFDLVEQVFPERAHYN